MPNGQFPVINAGQLLTALLLQSIAPLNAWKAGTTSRANNTLVADPDLTIPVAANGSYLFLSLLFAAGAAIGTADLKGGFTWPSGGSAAWAALGYNTSGATANITPVRTGSGNTSVWGVNGASPFSWVLIGGFLQNGSTAGNLAFEWAQNTTLGGTPTVLEPLSCMLAVRVA